MSLDITNGDPIILGLSSTIAGTTARGSEEKPEMRYEFSAADGVRRVSAVLTRTVRCLVANVEAVKQAVTYSGAVVTVGGKSFGAGWQVRSVNATENENPAVVRVELEREGVTPFEIEMPPGISVENVSGLSSLYLTNQSGKHLLMKFESHTGQDRLGWRVDFLKTDSYVVGPWFAPDVFPAYTAKISYEGVEMFRVAREANFEYRDKTFVYSRDTRKTTQAAAQTVAEEERDRLIEMFEARARRGASMDMTQWSAAGTVVDVLTDDCTINLNLVEGYYEAQIGIVTKTGVLLSDPAIGKTLQEKGLHWESVTDNRSGSSTHGHLFYRLRYAETVIFSIDVTASGGLT